MKELQLEKDQSNEISTELKNRLQNELEKSVKFNQQLEEQNSALVDILNKSQKYVSTLEYNNENLRADIKGLKTRLTEETDEKDIANNKSKMLLYELNALEAAFENATVHINSLTAAKCKIEEELDEAHHHLETFKKQLLEEQNINRIAESEIVNLKKILNNANEEIAKLEKRKTDLEARLQEVFLKLKEEPKERANQYMELLKSLNSAISTTKCAFPFKSRDIRRNQNHHLVMCNMDDSSIVECDPQTTQILNSFQLDSKPYSITIDKEENQWIVCGDSTVRKRQRGDRMFVTQFTLYRSYFLRDYLHRIAVTKKGKLVVGNLEKNQIEIWEQATSTTTITTPKLWNTTTTIFTITQTWKQTLCVSNFDRLGEIKVDSRDRIIVCDSNNNRVVVLTDELKGVIDLSARFKFDRPYGVAVDEMDNIFVAEEYTKRVVVFDCEGNHLNTFKHSLRDVRCVEVMNDSIYVKDKHKKMEALKMSS